MHELPVVTKILEDVLEYAEEEKASRVKSVDLRIGDMHDLIDEWVMKYFSFASRGTAAEKARLRIRRIPIVCQCKNCSELFILHLRTVDNETCPVCKSSAFTIRTGEELILDRIELEFEEE